MWFRKRGGKSKPLDPPELVLYTKPGCHLCDEMKAVVMRVTQEVGARVRELDISTDPQLEASLGEEIPVLFVNGHKAFKFRLTEEQLRRRLRGA
jgi:glutaredoxin